MVQKIAPGWNDVADDAVNDVDEAIAIGLEMAKRKTTVMRRTRTSMPTETQCSSTKIAWSCSSRSTLSAPVRVRKCRLPRQPAQANPPVFRAFLKNCGSGMRKT